MNEEQLSFNLLESLANDRNGWGQLIKNNIELLKGPKRITEGKPVPEEETVK